MQIVWSRVTKIKRIYSQLTNNWATHTQAHYKHTVNKTAHLQRENTVGLVYDSRACCNQNTIQQTEIKCQFTKALNSAQ